MSGESDISAWTSLEKSRISIYFPLLVVSMMRAITSSSFLCFFFLLLLSFVQRHESCDASSSQTSDKAKRLIALS